ncbi:MAG TPA: DUF6544 family protein [Solirubrobacterales bacterium]|jgi:hypothetical protein
MSEQRLPSPIAGHLSQVLPDEAATPSRVRLTQRGEMVQKPGGRRLAFTAVEELAVGTVAFEWRAGFGPNPFVRVRVLDRYRDGEGLLVAKVWGLIPATQSTGGDTDRAEAMRYLAELPWVPYAIAQNPELSWRDLEDGSVEVSTLVGGRAVSVRMAFDGEGLIRTVSGIRPWLAGKVAVDTPFVGTFGDYGEIAGIRVPRSAEVSWELPEGPFTYWRGEVTSLASE